MPIVACQSYILGVLDNLNWPAGMTGLNALEAFITPPDPEVDNVSTPHAYIWPGHGDENRNPQRGGTIPRPVAAGDPSGLKTQLHAMEVYLRWFAENSDPEADSLFPGMADWVMAQLRVTPDPTPELTDPWTGQKSYIIDVGEVMSYEITLRATVDERFNMYDCLITCQLNEVFPG